MEKKAEHNELLTLYVSNENTKNGKFSHKKKQTNNEKSLGNKEKI